MLIRACDIDKKIPAKQYTLTAEDGRTISKDLCEEHAEPFEEWLEEAEVGESAPGDLTIGADWLGEKEPAEEEPEQAPAVPKRRATKKVATKRATARKRPNIVTLEEIEARKKS